MGFGPPVDHSIIHCFDLQWFVISIPSVKTSKKLFMAGLNCQIMGDRGLCHGEKGHRYCAQRET